MHRERDRFDANSAIMMNAKKAQICDSEYVDWKGLRAIKLAEVQTEEFSIFSFISFVCFAHCDSFHFISIHCTVLFRQHGMKRIAKRARAR